MMIAIHYCTSLKALTEVLLITDDRQSCLFLDKHALETVCPTGWLQARITNKLKKNSILKNRWLFTLKWCWGLCSNYRTWWQSSKLIVPFNAFMWYSARRQVSRGKNDNEIATWCAVTVGSPSEYYVLFTAVISIITDALQTCWSWINSATSVLAGSAGMIKEYMSRWNV